jgi:hypothetical protein
MLKTGAGIRSMIFFLALRPGNMGYLLEESGQSELLPLKAKTMTCFFIYKYFYYSDAYGNFNKF